MAENTRELILDILLAVTRDGEFSHLVLGNVLDKYRYLSKQDRAFITRVSQGTLERMLELDYIINQFSKTKVNKMKPVIRCILRSGVYQLKYMDSVPASAACNEAVKLAVKRGFGGLKGFVNGVMRSISRGLEDVVYPDEAKQPVQALSVRYSMPEWIVSMWMEQFGLEQCKQVLEGLLLTKETCIRVNAGRIDPAALSLSLQKQGIQVRTYSDELPEALFLSGYDSLDELSEFREGLFYVQNLSSMMVVKQADPKPDSLVLDVCAAPGGKSIHMAQCLKGTGHVEARDLTEYKADLIRDNKERCQVANLSVKVWDATVPDPEAVESADIVIADLPCSGLGVIGSKSDIKYNATPEKIQSLAELQRQILHVVSRYVKPGGTLMYSTCTLTKAENEDNAAWFAENHPEFTCRSQQLFLPDCNWDGFFIAGFQKK